MSILKEIQDNSIDTIDLVMDPDSEEYGGVFQDLVTALKSSTSITSISLKKDFLGALFGRDRIAILQAVGAMPNIQEIELGDAGVMVDAIAVLAKSARSLRKLTLHNLILQGIQQDFDILEAALHAHGSLKEFEMSDCLPAIPDIDIDKINLAGKGHAKQTKLDRPPTPPSRTRGAIAA